MRHATVGNRYQFANTTFPQYFPGWFKACARNYNTTGSTVTLSLSTDG